ncbi:DUF4157 domain-containing protein [Bradyrhizobium sp.]|jgi:hypothetical protein|uniref:eCIS core domain-containing protein n=1 Tax=Bradyrhizobium sp. TaxID=376 RepID=UPI003C131EAD
MSRAVAMHVADTAKHSRPASRAPRTGASRRAPEPEPERAADEVRWAAPAGPGWSLSKTSIWPSEPGEHNQPASAWDGAQRGAGKASLPSAPRFPGGNGLIGASEIPSGVREVLGSPGQSLDPAVRAFMEPRFGHDLSRVRMHTDTKAAESARAIDARAYTVGAHVAFGPRQYAPRTAAGLKLLAHELTHVLQQPPVANDANSSEDLRFGLPDASAEREAEAVSDAIARSGDARAAASALSSVATPVIQRQSPGDESEPRHKSLETNFESCPEGLQSDLRDNHRAALTHVQRAITVLSSGFERMDPTDKASFRHYFDPANTGEIDDGFVRDVRENYQRIGSYMRSVRFNCAPDASTLCGSSEKWCIDGRLMWTCFGDLHVCTDAYTKSADAKFKIDTIIHESTHNALHTTDREYSSSKDFNRLSPRGSGILSFLSSIPIIGALFRLMRSNSDTLNNPDSYSGFAMHAGSAAGD